MRGGAEAAVLQIWMNAHYEFHVKLPVSYQRFVICRVGNFYSESRIFDLDSYQGTVFGATRSRARFCRSSVRSNNSHGRGG